MLQNNARPGFERSITVWSVQLIKHSAVNHLLLPLDGDCPCAELLEEVLILGIKLNDLYFRAAPTVVHLFGIDHIGLWHPRGWHQPHLQTMETDTAEKCMVSWVATTSTRKTQFRRFNDCIGM